MMETSNQKRLAEVTKHYDLQVLNGIELDLYKLRAWSWELAMISTHID
jgi:hypothetical protein